MKLKTYTAYKDSDAKWLGIIPEHWETKRLKYIATCNDDVLTEDTPSDYRIQYVDISNVSYERGIDNIEEYDFHDAPSRARRKVKSGDTILSTVRTYLKAVTRIESAPENMIVSTGFAVIRPGKNIDSRYLSYFIQNDGFVGEVVSHSTGVSYPAINASDVMAFRGVLPSYKEQCCIVDFLNHETTKIDRLLEKQEKLIELLKEKRQSVISHVVTNGLNHNVKMKDSGVEWLGIIPASWSTCAVWMKFALGRGRVISNDDIHEIPGEYPVFSSQTESDGIMGYISSFDFDGDYLTWTTDGANAGTVFERHGRFNCTNVCGTLLNRSSDTINLSFYKYALNTATGWFVRHDINPKLMNNVMASIRIPVLSIEEQNNIVKFIELEIKKLDPLFERAHKMIALLKERRTALISAAVTGKIDVRNWQPVAHINAMT